MNRAADGGTGHDRGGARGRLSGRARTAALVLGGILVAAGACGLPDGSERMSQPAEVRQRMGGTEIAVVYNRPSARGRDLFGALVPFDSVWNPGADEATRIEVSEAVLLEGERLPAGKYSLWVIPRPAEWTVIFSRAHDVYHVPYPEGQDALRLDVQPSDGPHMESLSFHFPVATVDSARLDLHWGRVVLPLRFGNPGPDGNE